MAQPPQQNPDAVITPDKPPKYTTLKPPKPSKIKKPEIVFQNSAPLNIEDAAALRLHVLEVRSLVEQHEVDVVGLVDDDDADENDDCQPTVATAAKVKVPKKFKGGCHPYKSSIIGAMDALGI